MTQPDQLLTASDVARLDGHITPAGVRAWADRGLLPCVRTDGGVRLFLRSDVERLVETRRRQHAGETPDV